MRLPTGSAAVCVERREHRSFSYSKPSYIKSESHVDAFGVYGDETIFALHADGVRRTPREFAHELAGRILFEGGPQAHLVDLGDPW